MLFSRSFLRLALPGFAAFLTAASVTAQGAVLTVTRVDATGTGSLSQTIANANLTSEADTIVFDDAVVGTINLAGSALPIISEPLTIVGPGYQHLEIVGGTEPIFRVNLSGTGDMSISGLSLNRATRGAITAGGSATLHVKNVVISGHTGSRSLIDVYSGGGLELENVLIANNSLSGTASGVSIVNAASASSLAAVTISGNSFSGSGSPVQLSAADLTVTDTAIVGNSAATSAGAIDASAMTLAVSKSVIADNQGGQRGGGISFSDGASLTVSNTLFLDNVADNFGGAIDVYGDNNVTIAGSAFLGNSAGTTTPAGGGALNVESGGAGSLTITDSLFSGNETSVQGGAIRTSGLETFSLTRSRVEENTAGSTAGGVRVYGTTNVLIDRSEISGNVAALEGAGFVILDGGSPSSISILNTTVADNISTANPAVILRMDAASGSSASIKQSTFSGNQGTDVAAVEFGRTAGATSAGSLSIVNSTFSGNTATNTDTGILVGPHTGTTIQYTTFVDNGGDSVDGVQVHAASKTTEADMPTLNFTYNALSSNESAEIRYGNNPYVASAYIFPITTYSNIAKQGEDLEGAQTLTGSSATVADPGLGALADNGGYTFTHAPASASSGVVDAGSEGSRPDGDVDQRGVGLVEVEAANSDLGSVEYTANRAPELTGNLAGKVSGRPGRLIGTVNLRDLFTDPDGDGVDIVSVNGLPPGVSFTDGADTLSGQLEAEGNFLVTVEVKDDVAAPETMTRVVRIEGNVSAASGGGSDSSGGGAAGLLLGLLSILGLRRRR